MPNIEIDPLTGAPIIKIDSPPAFTVANDDVAKSLDTVAKESEELKRNDAGQLLERPTNSPIIPISDDPILKAHKAGQLAAIKSILRNGMDSQQIEKAAKEIEKIL